MVQVITFQWKWIWCGLSRARLATGTEICGWIETHSLPSSLSPQPSGLTSLSLCTRKYSKGEFTVVFRSKILHKAAECGPALYHPLGMAFSFTTLWQTPDVFLQPANISQKQSELPPPTSPFLTCCQIADGKSVSPLPQFMNCKIQGWWSAKPRSNHIP